MNLKCDWCGSSASIIGDAKSFPGCKIAKCDSCHHEFEVTGVPTPSERAIWNRLLRKIGLRRRA